MIPPRVLLVSSIITLFTVSAMNGGLDYDISFNSPDDQTDDDFVTDRYGGPNGPYNDIPASLDETQVIVIVLSNSRVQVWLQNVSSYEISAFYDGYGFWYVNIIDDRYLYVETDPARTTVPISTSDPNDPEGIGYGVSALVEDSTGEIIDLFIPKFAILSQSEVISIVSQNSDVQAWFASVSEFEDFVEYDGFGFWYVSYYDLFNFNNFILATVNDESGQIDTLEISLSPPPTATEESILEIAMNVGLADFLTLYSDAETSIFYGFGVWDISAFSQTIIEASFRIEIDDAIGEVLFLDITHPSVLPTMNITMVLTIVSTNENYVSFYASNTDIWEEIYFLEGFWYVLVGGIDVLDEYSELYFVINDLTGEIVETYGFDTGGYEDPGTSVVETTTT